VSREVHDPSGEGSKRANTTAATDRRTSIPGPGCPERAAYAAASSRGAQQLHHLRLESRAWTHR
jgi:hypothetical protein